MSSVFLSLLLWGIQKPVDTFMPQHISIVLPSLFIGSDSLRVSSWIWEKIWKMNVSLHKAFPFLFQTFTVQSNMFLVIGCIISNICYSLKGCSNGHEYRRNSLDSASNALGMKSSETFTEIWYSIALTSLSFFTLFVFPCCWLVTQLTTSFYKKYREILVEME
jgi:ABC-type spermidine/putrescine transport system permease subunit II